MSVLCTLLFAEEDYNYNLSRRSRADHYPHYRSVRRPQVEPRCVTATSSRYIPPPRSHLHIMSRTLSLIACIPPLQAHLHVLCTLSA